MSDLTVSAGQPGSLTLSASSWCFYLFSLQMWKQQGSFLILAQKARLKQLPQLLSPSPITESYPPQAELQLSVEDGLPVLRISNKPCAEFKDHKERTGELLKLFINFFQFGGRTHIFDLTNYKLLLQGNFLHCALSLRRFMPNANSHLSSLQFWVLPLNWERTSRERKKRAHTTVFLLLKLSIWQLHFQPYGNESPCFC